MKPPLEARARESKNRAANTPGQPPGHTSSSKPSGILSLQYGQGNADKMLVWRNSYLWLQATALHVVALVAHGPHQNSSCSDCTPGPLVCTLSLPTQVLQGINKWSNHTIQ